MRTVGDHFLVDFWEVGDPALLDDMGYCVEMIRKAVELSHCKILSISKEKFKPQGLTIAAILSESHCSIHTWPEKAYCAIDLYGCGEKADLKAGVDHFIKSLNPGYKEITNVERGIRHGN